VLQYHLYIAALDLYLRYRLKDYQYETHFGGVFYLFLRGVHPEWGDGSGIFSDRPEADFVRRMTSLLSGGEA
jgi:exodeoxyribonuclease V beta subunit